MNKDVELLVESLIKMGVVTEAGLEKLAWFFRGLQAGEGLNGGQVGNAKVFYHGDAQEDAQGNGADLEARAAPIPVRRKRAPAGSFNPTKLELQNLRDTLTVKQIAELKGVSAATVNKKLKELNLTVPGRRGRPAGR